MYCEKCGAELEHNARFCSTCGKQAAFEHDDSVGQQYVHDRPIQRTGILSHKWVIGGSLVVVVLGSAILWMVGFGNGDVENSAISEETNTAKPSTSAAREGIRKIESDWGNAIGGYRVIDITDVIIGKVQGSAFGGTKYWPAKATLIIQCIKNGAQYTGTEIPFNITEDPFEGWNVQQEPSSLRKFSAPCRS